MIVFSLGFTFSLALGPRGRDHGIDSLSVTGPGALGSGPRSRRNGQHFPDDFTMFRPKCAYFWHIFGVFMTKCVYLRPNVYIYVQCGWFSGGYKGFYRL